MAQESFNSHLFDAKGSDINFVYLDYISKLGFTVNVVYFFFFVSFLYFAKEVSNKPSSILE